MGPLRRALLNLISGLVCFNVCFPLFVYSFNVVNNYDTIVFFFSRILNFALLPQRRNEVCMKTRAADINV